MTGSEQWMLGPLPAVDPAVSHLIRASGQIREEMRRLLEGVSTEDLWARPHGMTPAGFHAKHLAGSTARLCAYLEGRALTQSELAAIPREAGGIETAADLIGRVDEAFERYESLVRALAPAEFGSIRHIGRARHEVSAISLAIHIAEHGQRHVGQTVSAMKLVRT
jgi:hypothetical protein